MERLIVQAKNGDREAFTKCILEKRHLLYKVARTRLSCDDDIEDAIQETMIEAFQSLRKLREVEKFQPWLLKILINKCNKLYQKKSKKDISYEEEVVDAYYQTEGKPMEADIAFQSLLNLLNYEERIVIMLYFGEEYTTKEISQIVKTSENTIKSRIRRAKEKLKNKLEGGECNGSYRQ